MAKLNDYTFFDSTGVLVTEDAISTSAGAGSASKMIKTNAQGQVDITFIPPEVGAETVTATAGEALSAYDLVYINGSGEVMKAIATAKSTSAIGVVITTVESAATATIYKFGTIVGSGYTPGTEFFLSASTAGQATATAPTGAGNIIQKIGTAVSATQVSLDIDLRAQIKA